MPDDQPLSKAEKKRRRRARLLGLLLFNPYSRLQRQIDNATNDISDSFGDIGDAYNDGVTPKKAVQKASSFTHALERLIGISMLYGFMDASRLTDAKIGAYTHLIRKMSSERAVVVQDMMNATTIKMLQRSGADGHVLSETRARNAARYEASSAYFDGMGLSLTGHTHELMKAWVCLGDSPCDDICLSNEDEDLIPMDEYFQSGHYAPLGHPSCQCVLAVRRIAG